MGFINRAHRRATFSILRRGKRWKREAFGHKLARKAQRGHL